MASAPQPTPRGPFGARTFSLGRILGIRVGVDPSWFVIFALVTFSLGSQLAQTNATLTSAWIWGGALIASLLFFVSILLHELGHSVVSISLGLPVRSITLFIFGGFAQLSGEPARPRDEFLIAIAGPGVSVLLGLAFGVLWMGTPDDSLVGEVAGWLSRFNLTVAVFNMIPGFPLDGGHVFRAFLWAVMGDMERATRWAGLVGGFFARALIGLGLVIAFFGGEIAGGLFMAFVGWFLLRAARASVFQVTLKSHLRTVRAGEAMEEIAQRVDAWTTVEDAIEGPFSREGASSVFVEEDGAPIGVVSLERVRAIPSEKRAFQRVTEAMTPLAELDRIHLAASLFEALEVMERREAPLLLVVDDDEVLGVLSRERITAVFRNRMSLKG